AGLQTGAVGALARRFGERSLVRAGFALLGGAFIAAGLVPPPGPFLFAMGVIAGGNGLSTPSLTGLVSLATPPDEQGGILGAYQSLGSLGRAVGPFLGGVAFDHVSPGAPLWIAGAVLWIAALAAARLPASGRPPS